MQCISTLQSKIHIQIIQYIYLRIMKLIEFYCILLIEEKLLLFRELFSGIISV